VYSIYRTKLGVIGFFVLSKYFNLYSISLCGLIRRSYTLMTNSNASGSSDIGGIYRIGKGTATPVVHLI
jgi:hypothetical protein